MLTNTRPGLPGSLGPGIPCHLFISNVTEIFWGELDFVKRGLSPRIDDIASCSLSCDGEQRGPVLCMRQFQDARALGRVGMS